MGEEGKVYKALVGKTEVKRPLGRPRRRWMGSEWILCQRDWLGMQTGLSWLRIETGGGIL
jgi:hypothetical protein